MKREIRFKLLSVFAALLLVVHSNAQLGSITPVLLGPGGGFISGSSFSISYSEGESAVVTLNAASSILTQGFQQPSALASLGLVVNTLSTDQTCIGQKDGTATANISSGAFPYTYSWHTNPAQTTQTATDLLPGVYYVTVTDANNMTVLDSVTVKDNHLICGIHVYSGFSPNGDGKNDIWLIDNIELHLPNSVSVFNRWGDEVWKITNYDNSGNVWKGKDNAGSDLPDGTYFYIIKIGAIEQKGWVEITR